MVTKRTIQGQTGYSYTLSGVTLDTSDLTKQDFYKNGVFLKTTDYSLSISGSDTIITFVTALVAADTIDIFSYASLTLTQLKRQLKITYNTEDDILREILEDAITYVEDYTGIAMYEQTKSEIIKFENQIEKLGYGTVSSISSVKELKDDVFTAVDYTTIDTEPYSIKITNHTKNNLYKIEYTVSGIYPNQCRRAALMLAASMHEERENIDGAFKSRKRSTAEKLMDQVRKQVF